MRRTGLAALIWLALAAAALAQVPVPEPAPDAPPPPAASEAPGAPEAPAASGDELPDEPPPDPTDARFETLDDLLKAIEAGRIESRDALKEREAAFLANRDKQKASLAAVEDEVKGLRAKASELDAALARLDKEIAAVEAEARAAEGDYGPAFDRARDAIGRGRAGLANDLTAVLPPDEHALLAALRSTSRYPDATELRTYARAMLADMGAQRVIARGTAAVFGPDGIKSEVAVTRVGTFAVLSGGRFLLYDAASGALSEPARMPPRRFLTAAAEVAQPDPASAFVRVPIDPSATGELVRLYVSLPSWTERLSQGRGVGVLIVVLFAVGLVMALERVVRFAILERRMTRERAGEDEVAGNPLGRVLGVADLHDGAPVEELERHLEQAIATEIAPLERRIGAIKVMAGLATMLGLLGTVLGMIHTFEVLALAGPGEPKLLASGIAEALVTTLLGLIAAIPLLVLHTIVQGRSERLVGILEGQALGILAERSEFGRAPLPAAAVPAQPATRVAASAPAHSPSPSPAGGA